MIIVMILIRHEKDPNIYLLHHDRGIIIHRDIRNHVGAAGQAVGIAVIVAAIRDIRIDRVNTQDANGRRVDRAKAATNMISIHMKGVIREATATNIVDIEFNDGLWPCQLNRLSEPSQKKHFCIKFLSNV